MDVAVKNGTLVEIRDSKGEKYYQDAKGNITADRLRESRLQVKEIKAGTRVTQLVDNRIGRVTVLGKEITKGVKIGSKVIESKGLEADGARKVREKFGTDKKDAGFLKRSADRVLTKHEHWKEAGFIRGIVARTEMSAATKSNERDAVKALETKAAAGKQIEKRERESTDKIKESAALKERANPDLDRLRGVQQLDRNIQLDAVKPAPQPQPEFKPPPMPLPVPKIERGLER